MFTYLLYGVAIIGLLVSWFHSKEKTKKALKKAWKSVEGILPQLLTVFIIMSVMLVLVDEATISKWLGSDSGALGVVIAAVFGSITLIPGFAAFPLAGTLLDLGAGYTQITMFLTTLMMVGVVTFPMEAKYFGNKLTLKRNGLALCFAVCISLVIGGILR